MLCDSLADFVALKLKLKSEYGVTGSDCEKRSGKYRSSYNLHATEHPVMGEEAILLETSGP